MLNVTARMIGFLDPAKFIVQLLSFSTYIFHTVGVSRGYTDHHQGRGQSTRLTAALINIHEHLICLVSTSCHQLTSDHCPACMCHCIFFGINPRVSKHHAFRLHRATWWQLRLTFQGGYLCFTVPIDGRGWRGRSLSGSQYSYKSDVVFMQEQVCSLEEVHCGSARSTAGDGGFSDTRDNTQVVSFHLREHIDLVSGS